MAAPKGNKFAEKWDKETTLSKIIEVIYVLESRRVYSLSSALDAVELYADWWSDMTKKFADDVEVSRAIKKAETLVENRIVHDTMTGEAKSAAFSIFLLKNKFGYVDKQEVDQNTHITGINLKDLVKFE